MRCAAQTSIEMDRIWDAHDGWTVPEPGATDVVKTGLTYGACVGSLARHFASDAGGRVKLFAMSGKQHAVAHLGLDSGVLHPRWDSCYVHEDFMQVVRRFVQACVAGSKPYQAALKTVRQYAVAKHVVVTDQPQCYRR